MSERTLALVGIGLAAGFLSGVLGVGGGILIVPLLVAGVAYEPKPAMATSLAAILLTAIAAAASHAQAGNVAWRDAALIGVPAVAGAVLGAWLHQRITTRTRDPGLLGVPAHHRGEAGAVSHELIAVALGVLAGTLSALFGVGGGIIFVPTLIFLGHSAHVAVATSLAAMVPVIAVGAWRQTRYGAVNWHDALIVGVASVPMTKVGEIVATSLANDTLERIFAVMLLIVALQLAWRALHATPAETAAPDANLSPPS